MREHNRQTDKKCENEHFDMMENVNVKTRESGLVSEREMERVSLCVSVCERERERERRRHTKMSRSISLQTVCCRSTSRVA